MEWVGVKMVTIPHYYLHFSGQVSWGFMGTSGHQYYGRENPPAMVQSSSYQRRFSSLPQRHAWWSHEIPMEIPLDVIASSKITMRRWEKHLGLGWSWYLTLLYVFDDRSTLGTQQTRSCKSHLFPTKRTGHVPLRMPWLLWSRYPGSQVARAQRYVAGCCGSSSPKTMENQAAMKLIAID